MSLTVSAPRPTCILPYRPPSAIEDKEGEDRLIERALNFLITILRILDSDASLEDKIQEIIARIAFFGGDHTP